MAAARVLTVGRKNAVVDVCARPLQLRNRVSNSPPGEIQTDAQLHFDLLRLLDDRRGSNVSRRARCHVLAQAAETLHGLGYRGLKARGFKGRHVDALVAEWRRQGLSDGTVRNRLARVRWLAGRIGKPGIVRKDNASYGIGRSARPELGPGPTAAWQLFQNPPPGLREADFEHLGCEHRGGSSRRTAGWTSPGGNAPLHCAMRS